MTQRTRRSPLFAPLTISTTLALSIAGCRANPPAPVRESYVMAFLVSGNSASEMTPEMRQAIQAAHMENIGKLADEGKLVIAGPFGHPSPDDSMRGIFVFDTGDVVKAREWTATDPAVKAGVLGMEMAVIRTETKLERAIELYREQLAKNGGDARKDEMRGYAVVLAKSGESASGALGGLRKAGRIVFEGELEGSTRGGYVAVIDAKDKDEAKALLEPIAAGMGEHSVFPWWASATLIGLNPSGH